MGQFYVIRNANHNISGSSCLAGESPSVFKAAIGPEFELGIRLFGEKFLPFEYLKSAGGAPSFLTAGLHPILSGRSEMGDQTLFLIFYRNFLAV
jgi:hypothetical protein